MHTVAACKNRVFSTFAVISLVSQLMNNASFTCNTFIVIHIQILKALIDKSMLDFLQIEKNAISPLKPMVNIKNVAMFIVLFTYGKDPGVKIN